jgi:hypothetical protein
VLIGLDATLLSHGDISASPLRELPLDLRRPQFRPMSRRGLSFSRRNG